MAADPVRFDRKPYEIHYQDLHGQLQTIRRQPPPKLHPALPTDVVTLNHTKNDDFVAGEDLEVSYINPHHPNVLKLKDSDGRETFVDYYDVNLKDKVAPRLGVDPRDLPINNRYLLWP